LICPKCKGNMTTYERNGIHVDQCTECRGVFLDRGELEHLISAESEWQARLAPPQQGYQQSPPPQQQGYQQNSSYNHKKRKKNFLEELFD
jgi:uncharacterized protein